nr:hypothetical protein [Trebonia kvetii]
MRGKRRPLGLDQVISRQHDGAVPAAYVLGGSMRERLVMAGPELVRRERLRAADEVHREGGQLGPVAAHETVGSQRGDDAGVEAAGQQAAVADFS